MSLKTRKLSHLILLLYVHVQMMDTMLLRHVVHDPNAFFSFLLVLISFTSYMLRLENQNFVVVNCN